MNKDKVAVCMVTYNHEKYIAQAIESIMSQKGDFELTLYIGEDCSTDSTRKICREYEHRYGKQIKLIAYERNQGIKENFFNILRLCKQNAEYVAFCDGDDFWTDDNKLQIQIDALKSKPEYLGCFHNWNTIDEKGQIIRDTGIAETGKTVYTIRDGFIGWFVHINCLLLRSAAIPQYMPDYMYKTPVTDVCFLITILTQGEFLYIPKIMCTYRSHSAGASVAMNKGNNMYNLRLKYLSMINRYYNYKYDYQIRAQIAYDSTKALKRIETDILQNLLLYAKAKFYRFIYNRTPTIFERAYRKIF